MFYHLTTNLIGLHSECWSAPLEKGCARPPPLAGHRIARIDQQRAAMFGGRGIHFKLSDDLWVIDLNERVRNNLDS